MTAKYNLPPGWKWVKLSEVLVSIENGSRPKGGVSHIKEGIPSIGAEHLTAYGKFNFSNLRFISKEFYESIRNGKISKGDVLIVKDGATTGRVAFVGDDFPFCDAAINEHVFRLRGNSLLYQEYLFYFLYSPLGQEQIKDEFHGSTQGGINQKFANEVIIPIPPLSEQKRIAKKLKVIMDEIDKARASCEKQLEAAKALPSAYLREVFESPEAQKWERKKLSEVCEYAQYGLTISEFSDKVGYPLIRITDIDDFGKININNIKYVTCSEEVLKKYRLKEGDILFARTGSIGRSFLYTGNPSNAVFASYLIRFMPKKTIVDPYYLFYYTHSQEYFAFIEEKKHAVSQPNINAEEFKTLFVPLPPLSEQKRIVEYLKEKISQAEKLRETLEKGLEAINSLPQSILSKAFKGEI
ncbi:MAG: restriction endonuclease subunit S [Nitrososphaeria archaeon]